MSIYVDDDRAMPRFRVNRSAMTDPEVFARERDLIFGRSWLYVGHETELRKPNDFKTRTVGGRPVIFTRDAKGKVRVWINSCPHRGAMLCREPRGNARFMTCFYHGWSFSTSGNMVSMPDDTRDASVPISSSATPMGAEGHLRWVLENTPIVLWALDRDGIVTLSEGKALQGMHGKNGVIEVLVSLQ